MTLFLENLAVYSAQLLVLAVVAWTATLLLRVRTPRFAWRFWQLVMLIAVVLPLLQPRADASGIGLFTSALSASTSGWSATASSWDWTLLVFGILATGVAARLTWLIVGLLRIRRLIASAAPADALSADLRDMNRTLGTNATLLLSNDIDGPATIGVRRPVVLLPRSIQTMPAAVQRAIVCHELIHVTRRDWIQTLVEEAWCALLWFHPGARIIASRVSLARETVVDEATIQITRDRRAYAEALLAFAHPHPHVAGATPFIGRRMLRHRIALIAQQWPPRRSHAIAGLLVAFATSVGATAATVDRVPMSAGGVQDERVYELGPASGVSLPVVVREVKPQYTPQAMQKKIQGSVWLSCVVDATGKVKSATITKSLDAEFGLDDEALKAARRWQFKPAMKDGKPVAVRITIELTFTLRSRRPQ